MNSLTKFFAIAVVSIVTIGQFSSFRWGGWVHNKAESHDALESNAAKNELDEVVAKLQSIISASTKEIREEAVRVESVVGKLDTGVLNGHMERLIKLLDERTDLQLEKKSSSERYTKEELYNLFANIVGKEVKVDNWNMGCLDNQFMGPYFRAILYRRGWGEQTGKRGQGRGNKTIIDIGANTGDDTVSISKMFHPILQMCHDYSSPVHIVSVEPSPKVFCEMSDMVGTHLTKEDIQNMNNIRLNVALSDKTGHLLFSDPGHEGGRLIGTNFSNLALMTTEEYARYSECLYTNGEFRNMTLDKNRKTSVPTYTLDLLVSSLENLGKIPPNQEIFVVKIDTEGHDYYTLLGAKELLKSNRITFIIFEVYTNNFLKAISQHMAQFEYQCFLLTKYTLVPVHETEWWYPHLSNFQRGYWANGLCGIKGSKDLAMLWRMYHSDNLKLLNSYELLLVE